VSLTIVHPVPECPGVFPPASNGQMRCSCWWIGVDGNDLEVRPLDDRCLPYATVTALQVAAAFAQAMRDHREGN
jgi:hypothetical protein